MTTVCQLQTPSPPPSPPCFLSSFHSTLAPDGSLLSCHLVAVAGQAKSDSTSAVPRSSYKHLPCGQKCDRTLLCGHACGKPCHGGSTCPPCTHPCAAKCVHSQCQGRCTDMCAPRAEPCPWHCDHQVCHLLQQPHPWSFFHVCMYKVAKYTLVRDKVRKCVNQGVSVERPCMCAMCASICILAFRL